MPDAGSLLRSPSGPADLPPSRSRLRRGCDRALRGALVLLGREHEPGATFVQVIGVGALRVKCVGRDHRVRQIDPGGGEALEQRGELGGLVALRADLDLAQHQCVVMGGGGE